MKSSLSGARALILSSLAATAGLLFSACGQSPGQTGLDYLKSEGVLIAAPLYHLSFDDLPIDTVYGTEVPLNHYGESLLVVGREGDYIAKARMAFQFSTQAQRDSLAAGLHLRLTAIPLPTTNDSAANFAGRRALRDAARPRDSLRLLVESYSFADSGAQLDSLTVYHRRLLSLATPFSTLGAGRKTLDTITIYPRKAYPDSGLPQLTSQAGALPNLRTRLRTTTDTSRNWAVFIEISPLSASDSGMFHFIGQAASNNVDTLRRHNAGLWTGRYNGDSLMTVGLPIKPYFSRINSATLRPATNYEIRHTGASTRSLLHGVSRGMHLRINRDTLIHRIRLKLNAFDPTNPTLGDDYLGANPTGNFDRRFFVPYAMMRLPIDTAATRVPGGFAIDMGVTTDVDSLGLDTAAFRDDILLAAGADSLVLPVYGGTGAVKMDHLVVRYRPHPVDTTLRQVTTRWVNDPAVADTFITVPDGRHRELTLSRRSGWSRSAILSIKPSAAQLRIEVYFNVGIVTEPRNIKDSTGKELTAARDLAARFYRPGADSLNVRVTRGLRSLLNRNYTSGISVAPDMFLRSIDRAAYDTSAVRTLTYQRVVFPVTGEIDFKRAGDGRLKVGLELYLYPLEAGQ